MRRVRSKGRNNGVLSSTLLSGIVNISEPWIGWDSVSARPDSQEMLLSGLFQFERRIWGRSIQRRYEREQSDVRARGPLGSRISKIGEISAGQYLVARYWRGVSSPCWFVGIIALVAARVGLRFGGVALIIAAIVSLSLALNRSISASKSTKAFVWTSTHPRD